MDINEGHPGILQHTDDTLPSLATGREDTLTALYSMAGATNFGVVRCRGGVLKSQIQNAKCLTTT